MEYSTINESGIIGGGITDSRRKEKGK